MLNIFFQFLNEKSKICIVGFPRKDCHLKLWSYKIHALHEIFFFVLSVNVNEIIFLLNKSTKKKRR
jgi:hypothetical protein